MEPSANSINDIEQNSDHSLSISNNPNDFGLGLFKSISLKNQDSNIILSPLSINQALGALLLGAEGNTKKELELVMGIKEPKKFHQWNQSMIERFDAEEKITIRSANSLWVAYELNTKKEYLDNASSHYFAETKNVDFNSPATADKINAWISDQTEDLIPKMIESINPLTVMMIANAVYFNAEWEKAFDPEKTEEETFYNYNNSESTVEMMRREGRLNYYESADFQLVQLPYDGEKYSMFVLLPKTDINDFVGNLQYAALINYIEDMEKRKGTVYLPKFSVDYRESGLIDILQKMGLLDVFDPTAADLTGIVENAREMELHVGEIIHEAVIDVDEKGTEAAAATTIGIRVTSANGSPPPFVFRADRPFMYFIVDQEKNILFSGLNRQF